MTFNDSDDDEEALDKIVQYYTAILCPSIMTMLSQSMKINKAALLLERDEVDEKESRAPSLFEQRLVWDAFVARHGSREGFKRHMRMSKASFYKLLSHLRRDLEVNVAKANSRGGPVLPEISLYCCLRFCAGGSYTDISFFCGISFTAFYHAIWKCVDAINNAPGLMIHFPTTRDEVVQAAKGFSTISSQACIWNCVAVIDGYHLQIKSPSKNEVKNVRSFFSGHYQTYGVNVQAACDHNCRFLFIGVAGPGVMGDRDAINQFWLGSLIEALPGLFCAIGDCAYTPSEHLVPICRGDMAKMARYDNFNFYASQLRIRIEMAFGLMVKKWGILTRPLYIKVKNIKRLIVAIARLHNFCIDEQLAGKECHNQQQQQQQQQQGAAFTPTFTPTNVDFDSHHTFMREAAADVEYNEMRTEFECPWSMNRERMAKEIESLRLTRPKKK